MKPRQPDGEAGFFSADEEGGAPAIRICDRSCGGVVVVGASPLWQEAPVNMQRAQRARDDINRRHGSLTNGSRNPPR